MRRTAVLCVMLLALISLAHAADPLGALDPPATQAERALFEKYRHDPKAAHDFTATRAYLRKAGSDPNKAPQLTPDVSYKYVVNEQEEAFLWQVVIVQAGKAGQQGK